MNELRKRWKSNGTPFYFYYKGSDFTVNLSERVCKALDDYYFDKDNNITYMDLLVDIQFCTRFMLRLSDKTLISSLRYELDKLVDIVLHFISQQHLYVFDTSPNKEYV